MEATQDQLRKQVKRSTSFAIAIILIAIAAYLIHFAVLGHSELSKDPAAWGQFGDYLGGLLNPLIAFLAFFWLTRSVLFQRQELQETKKALEESASAQLKQVKNSASAARISALSTMLDSVNADVEAARIHLRQLTAPMPPPAPHSNPQFQAIMRRTRKFVGTDAELARGQQILAELLSHRQALIEKINVELGSLGGGGLELNTYPQYPPDVAVSEPE